MAAGFGAHEVMELHEVMTDMIDGINQFQLYRPHAKDPQLRSILDKQIQFMAQEFNNMVQNLNQRGMGQAVPYRGLRNITPTYGLNEPAQQTPKLTMDQLDDRDVASGMLGCHKASAIVKMNAALECADSGLRRMIQQGSINCSEQAYEVWHYMNHRGFYQVPTMKEMTTNTMMNNYMPTNMGPMM